MQLAQGQAGCPEIIPGLRAYPWWDMVNFQWATAIEAKFDDIKRELLALRGAGGF